MRQVASILGLQIGQLFDIENSDYNPHMFTHSGLIDGEGDRDDQRILWLLMGTERIMRKFFRPKEGQFYYYIGAMGVVEETFYLPDCTLDIMNVGLNNCFESPDQVTDEMIDEFLAFFRPGFVRVEEVLSND